MLSSTFVRLICVKAKKGNNVVFDIKLESLVVDRKWVYGNTGDTEDQLLDVRELANGCIAILDVMTWRVTLSNREARYMS